MITVDWGNYEETIIILRVEGQWQLPSFNLATQQIGRMAVSKSGRVDLLIDIRLADPAPAQIARKINHDIEHRMPNIQQIIAIATPEQQNSLAIIANFYPRLKQEILFAASVELAYQLVYAAA